MRRFLRFLFYLLYNNGLMTYNNFVKLILMCQFDFLIADVTLCHVNDTSVCKGLVVKLVVSLALLFLLYFIKIFFHYSVFSIPIHPLSSQTPTLAYNQHKEA
jgi:hypothetical protein